MNISQSEDWIVTNLAHRFTVSFFRSQYGDDPAVIASRSDTKNKELVYFNDADPDNDTAATICAGLLVSYMESQGIPYHDDKTRKMCFDMLCSHLSHADETVLLTADLIL